MFRMKRKLTKLNLMGDKVRIGLVGVGKMGRGLIHQMSRIDGMRPSLIVDEVPEKAYEALITAGVDRQDIIRTNSLTEAKLAIEKDKFIVSEDYELGYKLEKIEAMVDATGNPPFGAKMAYDSLNNGKHVIMLNVECDAVVGPILNMIAKKNDVVYTGSAGDEPGAIVELADFAISLGFELLAVGKGKNNPMNKYITEDDVREEALKKGLYPKILTSFIDGTNTMIELNSVANALGFVPDIMGCHGVTTNPKEIANVFKLKSQGGVLNKYGIVDFAFGMAPGVFAIVTSEAEEVKELMKYLKMGDGPNYSLYRPYHLTSLETPITIYDAIVEKEPTIVPLQGQVADVVTVAKRDLKKGEKLEGMGSKQVYGTLVTHEEQKSGNYLPIALIGKKTELLVDVKKDEIIRYDMVKLDEDSLIVKLREEQDRLGL
ncbi:NAD(P)H-dependent oxidoreductase [Microaceticoccus formicicus]|uniref:NAD(P)H-dependent oxidoreductase n=1 Tax=Microaceticoccus formicicus TaxID=3118105 RepID=UPI003CD01E68|nr:NAD(P)-dependent oxidoreductase [Peptoniphilaceae bacterium AMB_02]